MRHGREAPGPAARRVWRQSRRLRLGFLALAVLAAGGVRSADAAPRIGYLSLRSQATAPDEAFREGLRALGYVEGSNLVIEYRWAGLSQARLSALAAELVARKVDILVTVGGTAAGLAGRDATPTIPVLFAMTDPVGAGLVDSLARPGHNVTGISLFTAALSAKRIEILHEAFPGITRVAVLSNPAKPFNAAQLRDTREAATARGLQTHVIEARDAPGLHRAFAALTGRRDEALAVLPDPTFFENRATIVRLAARARVPTIYEFRDFVEAGGLMSYGTDIRRMYIRLASYVDRILKGARPADLPVEQPTEFELVVNLRTARALGLTIAPSVLMRADTVIP